MYGLVGLYINIVMYYLGLAQVYRKT